ncbi:HNH endonuclease [Pseudoalteromonas distincta]|uniref:HNH endonuclease n=1 Tax=Pseudoalteromonas distincta TaxID=77608 RepID=UPI0024201039|nr:HNH endonuclease [Pseudoalteromonas distincta]|tara:strand:+ start:8682 stop:9782 length:1101 start_codon:yes stop_codon:yes gene_type:complete
MIGAMQQQLDFIAYIQRLLVEGDFSATYKFALLHALADISIEKHHADPQAQLQIKFDELVDKFITLYWHQASPFGAIGNNREQLLLQNTNSNKQAKIITTLHDAKLNNINSISQLKKSQDWNNIRSSTLKTIKDGPLWLLQKLNGKEECFLYPHIKGQSYITLNEGIAGCFRRFYDLVVYLAKNAWLQKIQSIKHNQALIGPQSQLHDFLFGFDRNALSKAKPVLIELQHGNCFYCEKPLNSKTEVDHFIPFARYANDLGHNFVAAHSTCNNSKSDFLAAQLHRERWQEQNLVINSQHLTTELSDYFNCDSDKSLSVSDWAYQVAQANSAKLWVKKGYFEEAASFKYQQPSTGLDLVAEEKPRYDV